MSNGKQRQPGHLRERLAQEFTRAEDILYVGLGVLLAITAFALLVSEVIFFARYVFAGELAQKIVLILDRVLLIIMLAELLYTVQVSFREHTLHPEPFLIIGLIAVTRRVLVLTAELKELALEADAIFRNAMIELGLLTVLVVALVVSLRLLPQRGAAKAADRS